jgi:DNA-binding transcriptional MerR regulator
MNKESQVNRNKKRKQLMQGFPPVPDKQYFTISEVSVLCAVKPYVLRYWEQEFTTLRPIKRKGRRCYQKQDILLIREIRRLLYDCGYTIEGARAQLSNTTPPVSQSIKMNMIVKKIIAELESVLQNLHSEVKASH